MDKFIFWLTAAHGRARSVAVLVGEQLVCKALGETGRVHARAFTRIGRHNPKTRICAKCFAFAFP